MTHTREKTTVQVTRHDRGRLNEVQAEMTLARSTYTTIEETVGLLIDFWRQHHVVSHPHPGPPVTEQQSSPPERQPGPGVGR